MANAVDLSLRFAGQHPVRKFVDHGPKVFQISD
jgi:hypothetical protein